jgi:localization factor PodJL
VETSIAELHRVTERVASGEAVTKLAGEVRTLAERMDRFAAPDDRDALSSIEQRFDALSAKVHTNAANSDTRRLEGMIEALADQIQRLDLGESHRTHLSQIETQIAQLADRMHASETQFSHSDAIERTLADLHLQIEETRADASERQTVKRDLADLRVSQAESDRRIHQALGTIQDTIEALAHRLAAVETDGRDAARPAYAPAPTRNLPPATAAARAQVPAITVAPPPPAPAPKTATSAALPPALQMRSPIDPSLPANHPLEPGSGRSRAATPAERIAESEAALGPLRQNAPAEANEKANFIAAARRAAQAAAAEAAQANGRRADDRSATSESDEGGVMAKLKRPLFMSVAAAVLVVGGAHVTLTMLGSSPGHEAPRQVASASVAPEREGARKEAAADEASTRSAAPIPGPQLFAPNSIANPLAMAGAPAMPSQDITGSLPKTESATVPGASSPDSLPAAIGTPALRAAAVAGDAAAQYEIAVRYAEGRGVAQSFADSARWFERAAAKGLAPAQYRLGSFYEKGHGVKKDIEAARKLYISAAEKGNARAMHNLAVLYAEGVDGKAEYKTSYGWFRKAASFGVADSQYNLGILYARGIGVEQNLAESYKWFALAAQQGDQDAGRKRDDVASRLDAQSLVAAKLAAQTFTVESQPEEATTVKAPAGGWDRPAAAAAAPAAPATKSKAPQQRI